MVLVVLKGVSEGRILDSPRFLAEKNLNELT
jgi:hypothetical protein